MVMLPLVVKEMTIMPLEKINKRSGNIKKSRITKNCTFETI